MIRVFHPTSILKGEVQLPASKSISNRLLILKALYQPELSVTGLSKAADTKLMSQALLQEGDHIDVNDAGTVLRFYTAYASCQKGEKIISGTSRLHERPMKGLIEALRQWGADIRCLEVEGQAPLQINGGPLEAKALDLYQVESSQFITALIHLLPKLGPKAKLRINKDMPSYSFVKLTIDLMGQLGFDLRWEGEQLYCNSSSPKQEQIEVERDWTSFYYFFTMACLSKETDLFFTGLRLDSIQSESRWIEKLSSPLLEFKQEQDGLRLLRNPGNLKLGVSSLHLKDHPDLAPGFAMLFAALKQEVIMNGLEWLKHKESDREAAIRQHLGLLSCDFISQTEHWQLNSSEFELPNELRFPVYDDHRMAMSAASLAVLGSVQINDQWVVKKSFPNFWQQMEGLGFELNLKA